MITSSSNPQVKLMMQQILQLNKKAKTRYEQRVFVVEGMKMCLEVPKERIQKLYFSESFFLDIEKRRPWEGFPYEVLSDAVFQSVSDTKTPQGILCLAKDLLGQRPHLLVLEDIQDPGNLGTMIRTGEGAGVTGVVMSKATVDIFHPKVIRSTMGSLFRVPFYIAEDLTGTVSALKEKGVVFYAAHLKGKLSYQEADYGKPCGFLIGNEGNGLSTDIASFADAYIHIPMEGSVESLNAAIAAALLMYEAKRQRR